MTSNRDQIPTIMPTFNRPRNLGDTMNDQTSRLDGIAKVTGAAKYGRDMYLPNGLFAAMVRCPYGSAELTSHDQDAAMRVPGVVEVEITGNRGRYHGHSVGHIVAESPRAVERAMRALKPQWQRNRNITTRIDEARGDIPEPSSDTRSILDRADHVLEAVYSTQVQTHSSAETHGVVVDHKGDSAVVYASTQGTFSVRDGVDDAIGLPRSSFKVLCEYVGGGFGSKLQNGPETLLAARLGNKFKRPVYIFLDRHEEHLDTGNRPGSESHVKIGFNNDGEILGGEIRTYGSVGVSRGGGGVRFPSGRYNLGSIDSAHDDIQTNAGAPRPFRAPGCPQGAFAEELMLDEVATIAGIDPLELRIKLERDDDRKEMFRQGAEIIGWENHVPTGSQKGVVRRGFGLGSTSWGRFPAQAGAEVVINRDGSVVSRTGTQDIGTGQRTVMGVVTSFHLGVPLDIVSVRIGDSDLPIGPASGGSMTVHNTEPAMREAALDARRKLLDLVAAQVGGDADEFALVDGEVRRNGRTEMSFKEACSLIAGDSIMGRGDWSPQELRNDSSKGHSHGVQFAEVRVDAETGVVRVDRIVAIQACGRVVCRKTAESQIIGGVIQGISYALFEDRILDRQTGAMVNPNLEMYKVIGSMDVPRIEPVFYTKNETGTRSLGEPPTIPTSGAIACAIYNAIGAPVRSLPMTPDKILAAMEGAGA